MVTRSNINYEQHKKDVEALLLKQAGERKTKIFMDHYSDRYDEHGRSFISYKLAYRLLDDYFHCKKIGTRWFAFVGIGGMGKSTLAKNVHYFLDKQFSLAETCTEMKDFIRIIGKFTKDDELRSVYLDEPDDSIASHGKEGKKLRQIFGKIRQQKLFLGICATDLTDIPAYIYRKLDGIFFIPTQGKGMFFKNRPQKKSYVLQEIRKQYQYMGYKIFFKLQKSEGCLLFDCQKYTPLDNQEKKYLDEKRKDYEKNIQQFIDGDLEEISPRDRNIMLLKEKGYTTKEIADEMGVSDRRIQQILRKFKKNEAETYI